MNKSKIVFIGTFLIMLLFILTLSFFYSRAIKKKMHFLFQLGEEISRPKDTEPENAPIEISFANDGSKIISLLKNGNINVWNLDDQKKSVSYKTGSIFSYCVQNDYLITENDGVIYSVDINNGDRFKLTNGKYKYSSIDHKCDRLALSDSDSDIEVWSLTEPKMLVKIKSELPVRNGLSISPDGSMISAAEGIYHENENRHETKIETWKLKPNNGIDAFRLNLVSSNIIAGVWNIFFSPDSSRIIYDTHESEQSGIAISDLEGNIMFEKNNLDSYWTRALAISPDSNILASGDENGNLVIWDITNSSMLAAGLGNSTIQVFKMIYPKK